MLIDCDSEEAMGQAIDECLSDEELRKRLQTAGLQRAAQFTWEKSAAKTMAVLTEAARVSGA